jgi:uncharacterized repeat protein (TIGR01451 family)
VILPHELFLKDNTLSFVMVSYPWRIVGEIAADGQRDEEAAVRWIARHLGVGLVLASVGALPHAAAQLRLPAIDPSGQRILLPPPNYTTLNSTVDPATGRRQKPLVDHFFHRGQREAQAAQTPAQTPAQTSAGGLLHHRDQPAYASPPAPPDCPTEGIMPNTPAPEFVETVPYGPVAPRVVVPGSCQDPAKAAQEANSTFLGHTLQPSNPQSVVTLSPPRQIAPVGSEVVLIGGVCDGSGYYKIRAPVEWVISQGSVGHFVDPGRSQVGHSPLRRHLGDFFAEPLPELLSNNYAIGQTSRKVQVLTRGTVETTDDRIVESGQTWIGLTSPVEGTTYVTLMAPYLDGWDQRTRTAMIHWIDAQWTFPSSAIVQGIQPHTLTTTVRRKVSSGPIMGWTVRYEILDATANFEGGSTVREVTTDSTGAASISILPIVPTGGSAQVKVQVIRPPRGAEPEPLVLGEATTRVTWTTSLVSVQISGPESVELNGKATYRIVVSNPGTLAASNVYLRVMVPTGFQVIGTSPTGQQVGSRLDWVLPQLAPGQEQVFEVSYRAAQSGTARHCATVQSTGGAPTEDCLTTDVTSEALYIEMIGPNPDIPLPVGQEVQYQITVTNRGDRALADVLLTDRFDPGLTHQQGAGPIEWPVGRLDPGQSRQFGLTFRIAEQGRHCHSIEATATGTPPARTSACVVGQPEPRRDFTVRKTGPSQMTEGERADFYVLLENTGEAALSNLQIVDQYGPEFRPIQADPPASSAEQNRVVWYITRLEPGEQRSFQVNCEALFGNVDRACSDVLVRTADGLQRTAQKCLPIQPAARRGGTTEPGGIGTPAPTFPPTLPPTNVPAPGNSLPRGATPFPSTLPGARPPIDSSGATTAGFGALELTLDGRGDRWRVGNQIDYLVTIRNNRNVVDNNVILTIQLPPQVQLKNYSGPVTAGEKSSDWRSIRMVPIQTLRPNETVQFTISVDVIQAGELRTRAEVRSVRTPEGVSQEDISLASA